MNTLNSTTVQAAPTAPAALLPYRQWVCWRLEPDPDRPKKPRKVPYNPVSGARASSTDATTWVDHATAAAQAHRFNGIGFVFTAADPFAFIDLDDCRDPSRPSGWAAHAEEIVRDFPGAWEVSQSGNGLHGVVRADAARLASHRKVFTLEGGHKVEVYADGRFMAIGGGGWQGEPVADLTDALVAWIPERGPASGGAPVEWVDAARPGYDGPADDDDLIRRARASRGLSSFGHTPSFEQLWTADAAALGQFYPDDGGQGRAFDHSSADLALANALAWWTGCNPVRMLRLFKQSALWRGDERKAVMAIGKAIADPDRRYMNRAERRQADVIIGDDVAERAAPEVLTIDEAIADLVFVGDGSQVVSRSTKRARRFADAKHEWAASKEWVATGAFDTSGRPKMKGVPVIDLWIESRRRLSVDVLTWVPGAAEFCAPEERTQAGDRAFNLWTPPHILPVPDDWQERVKPFLHHVAYLVPVEAERRRFLCWLAHILQHPGVLPHTCYLMVATETGIGRGTLASILVRALRGYVAANMDVDALFGGFNGRLSQKLLATVDEIREGNSRDRYAKAEAFKAKVTEETRAVNPKYGVQSVERNCCRWLLFSNHVDALPFDPNDRRVIVIENPNVRAAPEWYAYLHDMLDDASFIASVQHYLMTLDLTGFNPHEPAPMNEAKARSLAALESDGLRACRQFAVEWPDELATLRDLRSFIGEGAPSDAVLRHDMDAAGMVSTGHRCKVLGVNETVIIVRGLMTREDVVALGNVSLAQRIEKARSAFQPAPITVTPPMPARATSGH